MALCEQCRQAEAVAVVIQLTADGGKRNVKKRHLCGACARQEGAGELERADIFGVSSDAKTTPQFDSGPTGAESFRPLHAHVLQLLLQLEATYDVTRSEEVPSSDAFLSPGTLEELQAASVLPPVLLTPRLATAAPLAVAFTTPPGLVVKCGRWYEARFGAAFCLGYEAWASAATEAVRLDDLLGKVVDGLFREEVRLPHVGDARVFAAVGDETPRGGLNGESWSTISRDRARILIGAGPQAVRWHAWPRRKR